LVFSLKAGSESGINESWMRNTDFFQLVLGRMRSLFCQVLESKDLSKAGDLFSVEDFAIVEEFPEITARIQVIRIGRSQYFRIFARIQLFQTGFRIRIRIRMDPHKFELLDPDPDPLSNCGSGSGSRRAKITHKNRKKYIIFMF
jgi:hypothetical protein